MSSSRSIAAARQRRAAEGPPPPQQRGPGTSINSQQAFAQQQVNQYPVQGYSQQLQGNPNQVMPQAPQVPVGKLSIGDAFALVTIRLGRIETIIQKLEAEGVIGPNAQNNSETMEHEENMRLVDDTVIRNIVARLGDLEKGQQKMAVNAQTKSETELSGEEIFKLVDQQISDFKEEFIKQIHELMHEQLSNSNNDLDKKLLEVNNQVSQQTNEIQNQVTQQVSDLVNEKLLEVNNQVSQQTNEIQTQVTQQVSELHNCVNHSTQKTSELQNILNELNNEIKDAKEIMGHFTSFSQETSKKIDSILLQQESLLKNVDEKGEDKGDGQEKSEGEEKSEEKSEEKEDDNGEEKEDGKEEEKEDGKKEEKEDGDGNEKEDCMEEEKGDGEEKEGNDEEIMNVSKETKKSRKNR